MSTELEQELLKRLIGARLALPMQLAILVAFIGGYLFWSRFYYRVADPALRRRIGQALGASIVWVRRHSGEYQTRFELGFDRYWNWSWGIAEESRRSFKRDGMVALLSLLCVNLIAGTWPIALLLLAFLGKLLSYVAFLPACLAALVIYSIFWAGRYEVTGMRQGGAEDRSR